MNAFPLAIYAAPFPLDFSSPHHLSSEITTNVYAPVVSSRSSEGASAALSLPVTLEAHSRAAVKYHREQTEAFSLLRSFSAPLKSVFYPPQTRGT